MSTFWRAVGRVAAVIVRAIGSSAGSSWPTASRGGEVVVPSLSQRRTASGDVGAERGPGDAPGGGRSSR